MATSWFKANANIPIIILGVSMLLFVKMFCVSKHKSLIFLSVDIDISRMFFHRPGVLLHF